jgi:hypothetical protein
MGRTFDLLLPSGIDDTPGLEFTNFPKNYVRKKGTLEEVMWARSRRSCGPKRRRTVNG